MRDIRLHSASSKQEGGCNACDDHLTLTGQEEHRVWVVTLGPRSGSLAFRLCDACLAAFQTEAAQATAKHG